MKMLITGSLGLVGSYAQEYFIGKGWSVVGIDSQMRSHFFGVDKDKRFAENIDIRDRVEIEELFERMGGFDAIIHTAAQPSHDWAKKDPIMDFDVNARGTLILLEAARKFCPQTILVHVSTDKVYGENMHGSGIPFNENLGLDFAGKRSLFGCSKTAADIYVQEYGNYFGMKTVCFRPGCITGKGHKGAEEHGFLAYLAKCIRENIPYTIFGDGETVRDQIHVHDLVTAFDQSISYPQEAAVYNIGGGLDRAVSVLEAIRLLENETGKTCNYTFGEERQGDRRWDVHDMSKFQKDYPQWEYKYSLQDIIKELA